jgi:hypothetical protein
MAQFETLINKDIEMSHIFEQDTFSAGDLQEKALKKLSREPIAYVIETYPASEGFTPYQVLPDINSMKFVTNSRIPFELVPFTNENKFPTLLKRSLVREWEEFFKIDTYL